MTLPASEIDVGKIKLVWRGTYDNSTAYEVDDLVVYNDSSTISTYICVQDSTGNVPSTAGTVNSTYWNVSAKGSSASAAGSVDGQVQLRSGTGFGSDTLLVFDTSNNRLGVGTGTPTSTLDVDGTSVVTKSNVGSSNVTGIGTISDTFNVGEVLQKVNVVAGAANATSNIDLKTSPAWLFTSNSGATWTHNIRGDASTSLDSMMAVGQITTVKVVSQQNNSSYYSANITIDGAAVTEYWSLSAPTTGAPSGYNTYTWTIVKTGSATFIVLATQN